jgi:hypothetical protein
MKEQDQIDQEYRVEAAEIARPGIEPLIPILPWPPRVRVSGLYAASRIVTPPHPGARPPADSARSTRSADAGHRADSSRSVAN